MAANRIPVFVDSHIIGRAAIATANANRDGSGTMGTVSTGAVGGTLIEGVVVHATVATTAGMIRLFIDDGVTVYLIKELTVTLITPSATVAAWTKTWIPTVPLRLPENYILKASTEKATNFNVLAFGGDY